MEELLVYHGPHVSSIAPGVSYQPTVAIEDQWRKIYTAKDIQRCIEKIQSVRYNETLFLFSTLSLVAYSSGHSLGSANWVIETSFKKIVFLSTTSLYPNLHPAPFDPSVLLSADAVIASNVLEPSSNHVSFERSRGRCMAHIARAIQANQNVLIASPSTNLLFDLIGDIEGYFKTIGIRELGPAKDQIPIYVAYPIAHPSLQYANICGEWMNRDRQSMLYEPETPLAHGHLMRQGALHTIPHIDSHTLAAQPLREPCIVFAGEARAMQSGALPWFFQHWKNTKTTCLSILPETDWPLETLPEKTEINFVRIPLETRLRLEDLPSVLRHTELGENTRHLLIPLMKGADLVREDLSSQPHTSVYIYKVGDIINIDLERDWEKVTVSEKLAKTIQPISQRDTEGRVSMYAPIRGTLHFYNNNYELEPNTTPEQGQPQIRVELNTIVQRFEQVRRKERKSERGGR
ncbi:beta-lactamase-like protein [Sporodiniella umbellata]|nr:beta-lactamase-like protein [Sporodiniella umbellata]